MHSYWRPLCRRVGQRAYKSSFLRILLRAVRIHQWSYWCGPGTCLFPDLGAMLRAAQAQVEEAQPPLRQHLRLRRMSAAGPPDEAETDAASMLQLFPTMALLQRPAAFTHNRPDFPQKRP